MSRRRVTFRESLHGAWKADTQPGVRDNRGVGLVFVTLRYWLVWVPIDANPPTRARPAVDPTEHHPPDSA